MMTAEPPPSPVTEGVRSLEVRWIFSGQLETWPFQHAQARRQDGIYTTQRDVTSRLSESNR
jgi:hypothetical protein